MTTEPQSHGEFYWKGYRLRLGVSVANISAASACSAVSCRIGYKCPVINLEDIVPYDRFKEGRR
jgi:hypothetical protein